MSQRVRELTTYILTLKGNKPKQRRQMMELASKNHMRGLEEVAVNIIKNTISLNTEHERICKRWRKPLRLLALKRYPTKKKKQILQQGEFLGAILPVLATVLGSIIGR